MTATSNFLRDNTKPLYQPWREEAFLADEYVRALTPIQRWMYRTLLQSAFICSTRPYLPDDDSRLWALAGCESKEQWNDHKEPIRAIFTPDVIDGVAVLRQKRVLEDWQRMQRARNARHESASIAGKASAAKRWGTSTDDDPDDDPDNHPDHNPPTKRNSNNPLAAMRNNGTITERQPSANPTLTENNQRNLTEYPLTDRQRIVNESLQEGGQVGSDNSNVMIGSHAGSPSNPGGEPTFKPLENQQQHRKSTAAQGESKPELVLKDLERVWQSVRLRNEDPSDMPMAMPTMGWVGLQQELRQRDLLGQIEEMQTAYEIYLEDYYVESLDHEDTAIKSPLGVFRKKLDVYYDVACSHLKNKTTVEVR